MPGPDRDFSESRIDILSALEEAHLPEYPDLASAPDKEGLTVTVTGEGADPAGTYTFISGQWSGPMGGESNLPDTNLDSGPVANTEQYSYGEYLTGAVDPDNAKHVTTDLDTAATDKRYLRILVDSFDHHAATDPGSDQPTTPQTWRFVPGESSAAVPGGYFYDATPSGTQSARSFGCDFTSTTAPDDSTISSSAWAIEKEYAVGAGGHTLDVSAWAQPTASYSAYDDGMAPSPEEAFLGEDDVFVAIEAFDSSLQSLALDTTTEFSRTASHQHFAGTDSGDLGGDEWVEFSHEATLPAATAFVRVRLQTAAHSNTWDSRGTTGSGNAAIVLDDYSASYTAGLRESAVLAHDHEGVYAGQGEFDSHVSDDAAHHSRYTDTDAQQALSGHTSDASAHHAKRTDAQVADALTDEFINPPGIGGAVDRPQSVSTDQIITDVVDADQIGTAGNPVSSVDTDSLAVTQTTTKARPSTGGSINDTNTTIPLDTVDIDQLNAYDSANETIIIQDSGTYMVTAQILFATPTADGYVRANAKVNGTQRSAGHDAIFIDQPQNVSAEILVELQSGDTLTFIGRANTGGTSQDYTADPKHTFLEVHRVG